MSAVAAAHPAARVEAGALDAQRVGLKPILRRIWHRRGQPPCALIRPRSHWLYVYAFVAPTTGQTCWLRLPSVSTALFNQALAAFAAAVGVGPPFHVVLPRRPGPRPGRLARESRPGRP